MIRVDNIVKYYGEHLALKGISYTINKGEIVGFLGPNGAGKSTMMRIITGYLPATSGFVYLDDYEIYDNPIELKRRIGYKADYRNFLLTDAIDREEVRWIHTPIII